MADFATARVQLWGHEVGIIVESEAGRITFEAAVPAEMIDYLEGRFELPR